MKTEIIQKKIFQNMKYKKQFLNKTNHNIADASSNT